MSPLCPDPIDISEIGRVAEFLPLRSISCRQSAVYKATLNGKPVVVKCAVQSDNRNELTVLNSLKDAQIKYVPSVIHAGALANPVHQMWHYIVLTPFGEHITYQDSSNTIRSVLSHVCQAMLLAYTKLGKLLHRDISLRELIKSFKELVFYNMELDGDDAANIKLVEKAIALLEG